MDYTHCQAFHCEILSAHWGSISAFQQQMSHGFRTRDFLLVTLISHPFNSRMRFLTQIDMLGVLLLLLYMQCLDTSGLEFSNRINRDIIIVNLPGNPRLNEIDEWLRRTVIIRRSCVLISRVAYKRIMIYE